MSGFLRVRVCRVRVSERSLSFCGRRARENIGSNSASFYNEVGPMRDRGHCARGGEGAGLEED